MYQILRERMIWEFPGVSSREAAASHAAMERLQERAVVPALERFLESRFPPPASGVLDRLSIDLVVPRGKTLADLTPEHVERALLRWWRQHPARAATPDASVFPRPVDPLHRVLTFLTTGCLSAECPTVNDLLDGLPPDWPDQAHAAISGRADLPEGVCLRRLAALIRVRDEAATVQQSPAASDDRPSSPAPSSGKSHAPARHTLPDPVAGEAGPDQAAGYLVGNAGLVLLHPYLDFLERHCHAEKDLPLMAELLHYATFGDPKCGEWDHPLTKVLLGRTPTDYLPPAGSPPEDWRLRRVDELLDGVLEHWAALGSTDRDGLRQAFLQRPGKLSAVAGGWLLQVERRAYDVLLDRLPWPYSIVKTGAMAAPLHVSWI